MQIRLQFICNNRKFAKQIKMAKKTKHNVGEPTLDMGFDEMDAVSQQETGPVTVLGMTFSNDEERRAYFREQLRAKLPELRNIEGFPIGSDDDIVNLSDPPYYTACPNPWLNDFIAEWEQEKLQLEAEGKRHPNVVVNEPYAADVSEGKNNPIYTAHTYHTKVPHPAIMRYILNYTQPGDIVLDGFAGTGMTGVAATGVYSNENKIANKISVDWYNKVHQHPQFGVRHAICGDLSPYATSISRFYNTPFNLKELKLEIQNIISKLTNECGHLYDVKDSDGKIIGKINFVVWSDIYICPNCGNEYVYWTCALDAKNKCLRDEYECPHCGSKHTKKQASYSFESIFDPKLKTSIQSAKRVPVIVVYKQGNRSIERSATKSDIELALSCRSLEIDSFYPVYRLPQGQETRRNDSSGTTHSHHFFENRALYVLSKFWELIHQSKYSNFLEFIFTGLLQRASKMNRVHVQHYFNGGGGWNGGTMKGTMYIPSAPIETSIIEQISDRWNAIERAYDFFPTNHNNVGYVGSASSLNIADNSIDYIFIDPPFGANIFYSELNSLIEAWFRVFTNNSHEAIENKAQDKDSDCYRNLMGLCFKEFFRVLKPGKWMTVEFSNTSAAVWNALQIALQSSGFVIASVSALDKKQGSFNAVTTTTAVKQDLIISCFKPTEQLLYKFENEASETNVWDFIDELLSRLPVHLEHSNKTTAVVERSPKILYDRLISFYVQHGFPVPLNAQEFQAGLRERYAERDGMYFTPSQAAKYDELRKRTDGFQASLFFVDSEQGGIAWLNNELSTPQTYQDLQPKWMQAINGVRKGDILPELMQILEENFIKESDGKWRKPNLQDDVDLAALRHKALMREFKVYVEVAQKPRGKIKEARVEALRAGFKQCYQDKDFATIVAVGDRIPQNLLTEDEQLLQFYEIASSRV